MDGPYIESERDITLQFRGSRNQRIIDVGKTLKQGQVVLWDHDSDFQNMIKEHYEKRVMLP